MIRHRLLWIALAAGFSQSLGACQIADVPKAQAAADLSAEIVRGERPVGPEGACWTSDETPAVIETITDFTAEEATADTEAGIRTQTRQQIVEPREQIWFRVPCEAELTPQVITTMQRALAVRGFYAGEPTGVLDPETRSAIRAFQIRRGLNSDRLSLAAARELGVIAADFGEAPQL